MLRRIINKRVKYFFGKCQLRKDTLSAGVIIADAFRLLKVFFTFEIIKLKQHYLKSKLESHYSYGSL